MKILNRILLSVVITIALAGAGACSPSYDTATVNTLTEKVSAGAELTQTDYSEMIEQYGVALEYLVAATDSVMLESNPETRLALGRQLRDNAGFRQMQRVWSDFGSVLFQARAHGELDDVNLNAYMELAPYSDRFGRNMAMLHP